MPELTPLELVWLAAIFFAGGMVKGGTGFGLPLVTISLLPLVIPIDLALVLNGVMLPLVNISQFVQQRLYRITLRRMQPIVMGLVVGTPLGALLVSHIDKAMLGLFVGLLRHGCSSPPAPSPRALPCRREPSGRRGLPQAWLPVSSGH